MHLRHQKIDKKKCNFHNNSELHDEGNKEVSSEILDIKRLVGLGNKQSLCPCFKSRNQKVADIVSTPHNYLVDTKACKTYKRY